MTAPVRDFFGDLIGWVVAAIAPGAVPRLLDEVNGEGRHVRAGGRGRGAGG